MVLTAQCQQSWIAQRLGIVRLSQRFIKAPQALDIASLRMKNQSRMVNTSGASSFFLERSIRKRSASSSSPPQLRSPDSNQVDCIEVTRMSVKHSQAQPGIAAPRQQVCRNFAHPVPCKEPSATPSRRPAGIINQPKK